MNAPRLAAAVRAALTAATIADASARAERRRAGAALAALRESADDWPATLDELGMDERSASMLIEMHAQGREASTQG